MSKKLLSFFLDELKIIRVTCQSHVCGATVEAPIEKAEGIFSGVCPVCKKSYFGKVVSSPISMLAKIICEIAAAKDDIKIEFVIPDTDSSISS
jgi:hypothetical protein